MTQEFKDHIVQHPNRFRQTTVAPGVVELTPTWVENPSEVVQLGTPVDRQLINGITSQLADRAKNIVYVKSTDNLQTALNNAMSNQTLVLVDMEYSVASPLTLTGKNLITIKGNGRAKINYTGPGNALTIRDCPNINIENVSVICNGLNDHGIAFINSYRCRLKDVLIFNTGKDCLNLNNSWWFTSENSTFDRPGTSYACVNHGTNSNNMQHLHSRVVPAGQVGFLVNAGANTLISNCDLSGAGVGVSVLGGSSVSIEECYFELMSTAVQIGSTSKFGVAVDVSNCYISGHGIKIIKGSNINIKTNFFYGTNETGIEIYDDVVNEKIFIDATNYFAPTLGNKVINPNARAYYQPKIQTTNQFLRMPLTSGLLDIDLKNNSNFLLTVSDANYRQLRFINTARTETQLQKINLIIKYDAGANVDYFDAITWQGGARPSMSVGKIYLIQFIICGTELPILASLLATY